MRIKLIIYNKDIILDNECVFPEKIKKSIGKLLAERNYSFSFEQYSLEDVSDIIERKPERIYILCKEG